jgi:hypothetical protein
LNLGEAKASGDKSFYRAAQPPGVDNVRVIASSPSAEGSVCVTVAAEVLAATGEKPLGTFAATYDIQPSAEVTVSWHLERFKKYGGRSGKKDG